MKKHIMMLFFLCVTSICFADTDFDIIFEELMKHEGKVVVTAEDGTSKFGLTKYYHPNPASLTEQQAKQIIYEKVYKKYNIDKLNSLKLKHICLDFVYHTNPYNAIRMIKSTVGLVNDKVPTLDEETIHKLNSTTNIENIILNKRQSYIRSLKLYSKYKKGWEKRITYLRKPDYEITSQQKLLYVFKEHKNISLMNFRRNPTRECFSFFINQTKFIHFFLHFGRSEKDYFTYVKKMHLQ